MGQDGTKKCSQEVSYFELFFSGEKSGKGGHYVWIKPMNTEHKRSLKAELNTRTHGSETL